jgi:putative redox protein
MHEERICFSNSRGDTLAGVLHHPDGGADAGAVVLCHGMESDKNSEKLIVLSKALAERGILTLRFDFSYVGESSGKYENITYTGEVDDLRAAYWFMRDRRNARIGVLGSSMGGTVALLFAAQEPSVAALVTIAAPLHPERFPARALTAAQLEQWRELGFTFYHGQKLNVSLLHDLEKLDIPQAVRKITCPVLVVHGDADEVVPVEEAQELHACLVGSRRLSILPGCDHRLSDPDVMRAALADALDWLTEHVQCGRG